MKKKIYVLIGPSGSGKTTLGNHLQTLGVPEVISHTTREIRIGEKHGVNYYYATEDEFNEIDKIEEAYYDGNRYCVSVKEMEEKLDANSKIYIIAERDGANMIRRAYPEETIFIYIRVTPSEAMERMRERGDSPEKIKERMNHAREHMEFEVPHGTDFIVRNSLLSRAQKELESIVSNNI